MKILLIDNDSEWYIIFKKWLKEYDIDYVSTVADGIIKIRENKYDLVLCDYRMPESTGTDGFNLLKVLFKGTILGITSLDPPPKDFLVKEKNAILEWIYNNDGIATI